jgi:ribosomal protein S4
LRHFYGKVTEAKLRRFYKTHLIDTVNRNKSFFGALECRADMFLFRLRLLPTIYACHQYVHHHGLVINKVGLEKSPHALVRIGDRISIPQNH